MSEDPTPPPPSIKRERERASKPVDVARVRQPIKDPATRLWRARFVDLEGVVRQAGRFERKGDAVAYTAALVAQLGQAGAHSERVPTLTGFLEEWPRRFPRHPRTQATNTERIQHYLLPLLPNQGEVPLDEVRRTDLRAAQDTLLRRRLAKSTIDGAFSALSALMRDAMDIELIDANPAARMRVRPADPQTRSQARAGRASRRGAIRDPRVHGRREAEVPRGVLGAGAHGLPSRGALRDASRRRRPRARDDLPPPDR